MTLIALTNVNRASAALNLPLGVQTGFVGRLAAPEQELHTVFKFAVTDDGGRHSETRPDERAGFCFELLAEHD